MEIDVAITDQDLRFFATVCMLSLRDLGYIPPGEWRPWAIEFSDECEGRRVHGGTLQNSNGQGILINPNATRDTLPGIIAHEAVHLVQFMRGDARNGSVPGRIDWKGISYQILPGDHPDYEAQPWEEEAYRVAPEIIRDLKKVPITEIMKVWLEFQAQQWCLDYFVDLKQSPTLGFLP